ncbi:MAG: DegT/DnrJ/EryC1/StrS family aminotransferase [Candidatus Sericytochromatia bacterium]|nr:DegT/DnrJ/EryC1/StrS family aminotransferase [Candidatus Sericytochromatia bacterium]
MIPILDLKQQYLSLQAPIEAALRDVMLNGHFILGPNVKAFEAEIGTFLGSPHAIGVASGTDALHLALRALDIGPGDEVITTPMTFVATTEAIGIVGASPVFVDIEPDTFNLNIEAVAKAITPRTKAIMPVHLYGQVADMDALMALATAHNLAVIEDCAQSMGATFRGRQSGTIGTIGCYSFFPSKNLGAYGDGGLVATADPELAARIRSLRAHGGRVKYHHEELGLNSRLDEMQAAILRIKLPHLAAWNEARRAVAKRYRDGFAHVPEVTLPAERDYGVPVYHQFTVRVADRDAVRAALDAAGVSTMVYYPVPLHMQKVHANLGHKAGDFPHTEKAVLAVLSLPMFPELSLSDQDTVIAAVTRAVRVAV